MVQQIRERMNKWDCIKLKTLCTAKETVSRLKRLPTEWEKIFVSYSSDNGVIFRKQKEYKQLHTKRKNNLVNK
jgi:hypothetical protein